ncbi:MAG: hypothetical protein JWQ13_2356 [Ramlibacter sp.]|jgi:glycosyl transferase family 25|nr:hypothetical protein [Ramlibacter sp.]
MQTPLGIDAIFVIHAASLAERRKLIEAQLSALGLRHEFILDYDIPAIPQALRDRMIRGDSLSPAQQSCALKHWHAHVLADQRGCERVLVLEDDVILAADFRAVFGRAMKEELALAAPHVTFLGCGGHYYVPRKDLQAGRLLYRRDQGKFADSYIVDRAAVKRRLQWLEQHGIERPIDHQFEAIDRELGTAMYWLEPPIVEQGSHNGRFPSALVNSHPLWFQALQFRWKKLWRRKGMA